jgi:hypothetical protein
LIFVYAPLYPTADIEKGSNVKRFAGILPSGYRGRLTKMTKSVKREREKNVI